MYAKGEGVAQNIVKVFFGTDRKATTSIKPAKIFANERGKRISYGSCEVSIPFTHDSGNLEEPFAFKTIFEDPRKHIVLLRVELQPRSNYYKNLNDYSKKFKERKALVFIHGYNNSFEDSARRTAQIAYDTKFSGVPIFYSWPSKSGFADYFTDGSNAEQAISYLKVFLKDLVNEPEFDSIYLLAHSMGDAPGTLFICRLRELRELRGVSP